MAPEFAELHRHDEARHASQQGRAVLAGDLPAERVKLARLDACLPQDEVVGEIGSSCGELATHADIDVANTRIFGADVRGNCGDTVVDKVYLGHGRRKVLAEAAATVKGGVTFGTFTPSGGVGSATRVLDEIARDKDQAYRFTCRKVASEPSLDHELSKRRRRGRSDLR